MRGRRVTEPSPRLQGAFTGVSGVKEVAKTVKNVKSIWIDNFTGTVEGDRITEYRVNARVSFLVEGHK